MDAPEVRIRPFEHPASGRARTATLYQSAVLSAAPPPAVVVLHGLFVHRALPEIDLFCRRLAARFDVVAADMRGHGEAPGRFTWGREEQKDLADLVSFLRAFHPAVGVVGFSFGGDVAIFSAALSRERDDGSRPDAICTIGAPAHLDLWRFRLRPFGWLAHLRMILGRRRRFVPGWPRLRWARAMDLVGRVSPAPLLILHGERDWLVHPDHARRLYAAAGPPKEIRILEGALHAEYIIAQDPDLLIEPVLEFFGRWLDPSAAAGRGDVSLTREGW